MEKLLCLSAGTKILLPGFKWWALKDEDYQVNFFQAPNIPGDGVLLSLKVNCSSVCSQLTL